MRGKSLFWILFPSLALLLLLQARTAQRVLRASQIVRLIEATSPRAAGAGAAGEALLRRNLALAQEAVELDPSSVAAAQAKGSVYLLLGRPQQASDAYEAALRLQPAAELYMDLGHASFAAGDLTTARRQFARAVKLDNRLLEQVPAAAR